jgi:hypothetical protein
MSIIGHVSNGVVVFDEALSLPEGTRVEIQPVAAFIQPDARAWDAAMQAASELGNYDFDAWRKQRECDLHHAADHLP